jgi:acetyltransferase
VRGAKAADNQALAELMVALSRFAADHADQIAEIDLNPVIVHEAGEGLSVVDALIVKQ